MSIQGISNDLDMRENKIVHLDTTLPIIDNTQALSYGQFITITNNNYLRVDGTNSMTGNMNLNSHKIINLSEPTL